MLARTLSTGLPEVGFAIRAVTANFFCSVFVSRNMFSFLLAFCTLYAYGNGLLSRYFSASSKMSPESGPFPLQ